MLIDGEALKAEVDEEGTTARFETTDNALVHLRPDVIHLAEVLELQRQVVDLQVRVEPHEGTGCHCSAL